MRFYATQHAIKNIGRKMLNLNDLTFNKRLGNSIGKCFEIPNVSYCHHCRQAGENTLHKINMTVKRLIKMATDFNIKLWRIRIEMISNLYKFKTTY